MTNFIFPSHYDEGQLRLRCERLGLSYAYREEPVAWYVRWWRVVTAVVMRVVGGQ